MEPIREVLARHAPCGDPDTLVKDVHAAIEASTDGTPAAEDITLVVVERVT